MYGGFSADGDRGADSRNDISNGVPVGSVVGGGAKRERSVSLATKLSRMRRVGCDVGVSSRVMQAARFSPVLLEDGEFPIVGGRSFLIAKYGIIG